MLRIASTARPVTSSVLVRTLTGYHQKLEDQPTMACKQWRLLFQNCLLLVMSIRDNERFFIDQISIHSYQCF